jgi:uncharacterized protein
VNTCPEICIFNNYITYSITKIYYIWHNLNSYNKIFKKDILFYFLTGLAINNQNMMSSIISPTLSQDRIATLDILRGFAIFGILMVNMMWFNTPLSSLISDNSMWTSPADQATKFMITFLFEGKFYVLFSMLFGYGFWLFLNKPNPEGKSILRLYAMRLFILLLIGVAHVLLLWPGDILIFYALLGFVLILFRNVKNKTLLIWAIIFIFVPVAFIGLGVLFMMMPEARVAMEQVMLEQDKLFQSMISQALVAYREGTFVEMMHMRLREYSLAANGFIFFQVNIMAMFLIGQYAARKGYLKNTTEHLPFFRKLCLWGFIIGIPTALFGAYASVFHDVYSANPTALLVMFLRSFGSPALTLAYVSGIILLIHNGYLARLKHGLAAVGRMALTNYLLHSIIASFLFYGYGLGWYGQMPPWLGLIPVFVIFGLQIPFSIYWLKHFRFGPFEWLWRSLTYLKWQPMKRLTIDD